MADLSSIFQMAAKRPTMADLLMKQSIDTSPTPSPGAAIARALMGGIAGYLEKNDSDTEGKQFDKMFGLTPGAPAQTTAAADVTPSAPAAAASPAPSPQAVGEALQGNIPRGIRNNNPLNIEAGDFTKSQPGFTGSDGRFAQFQTPQQGIDAAGKLLDTYQNKYGLNTVRGIINRWAPQGENPTSNYVASVAGRMGVDPDQPLTAEQRPALISAMGQFENGRPIQMAQAAPQIAPNAPQGDTTSPPNAQPTSGYVIPGQPPRPGAPQVPQNAQPGGQGPLTRPTPQVPPDVLSRARELWTSGDPTLKASAMALVQPYLQPKEQWLPLTDPMERARRGISTDDKNAYEVNSLTNQVKPVNPQPFSINLKNTNETSFEKQYGEGMAKSALATLDAGSKASMNLQRIQLMRALNDAIQTGKLTEAKMTIGAWASAFGVDPKMLGIDPDLPANAQTLRGLANESVLGKIGGEGGMPSNNFSDADRKFLQQTATSLTDQPEANAMKLTVAERLARLQEEKANAWVDARDQGKSYEQFDRDWRKQLSQRNIFGDLAADVAAKAEAARQQAPQTAPQQPAAGPSVDDLLKKYGPKK